MSNIFDIPQIPAIDFAHVQNDLHIGFGGDVSKRIQKVRWTDETRSKTVFPENVDALMGAFVMAQATEDAVYVQAQAIVLADNYRYTDLIASIGETIRYYRQISDDRRRSRRRVSVKSDVVGNHTYATASGWTWERRIQDGKALLAVSDAPAPARIVSTDKKALKAGGLLLALNGVAVKPTDEIDVDKEYELVAAE